MDGNAEANVVDFVDSNVPVIAALERHVIELEMERMTRVARGDIAADGRSGAVRNEAGTDLLLHLLDANSADTDCSSSGSSSDSMDAMIVFPESQDCSQSASVSGAASGSNSASNGDGAESELILPIGITVDSNGLEISLGSAEFALGSGGVDISAGSVGISVGSGLADVSVGSTESGVAVGSGGIGATVGSSLGISTGSDGLDVSVGSKGFGVTASSGGIGATVGSHDMGVSVG
ncbi:hypothetical protein JM18_001043 [Phytophthora kernoviae]|uniref:Uncharacterized protein n=1 Tax=Phytophthora kernoviae TaxID=325452 RepID=A0A8T0M715_9STRA|nr:hypothetical protein JM16_000962 [Phytophthora kernoviae]KAG2530199.1 hypothetical protein JM18_001043 [Phytophthora kernoviae]